MLEQAHVPDRIHAAVADRVAEEVHQPRDEVADRRPPLHHVGEAARLERLDRGDQGLGQALVGVEMQFPGVAQRQCVDRPIPLGAVAFEWVGDDPGPVLGGDRKSLVTRPGINYVDIVRHPAGARQGGADRRLGVEGQDDDRQAHGWENT